MIIEGFGDYIENGLKDIITDFTINEKCSCCGNCCSNILPMSKKEIDRIKKYIKENDIKEIKHFIPLKGGSYDMTCPFRDDKNKICTIYEVRPKICKLFVCNKAREAKATRDQFAKAMNIVEVRKEFFNAK